MPSDGFDEHNLREEEWRREIGATPAQFNLLRRRQLWRKSLLEAPAGSSQHARAEGMIAQLTEELATLSWKERSDV